MATRSTTDAESRVTDALDRHARERPGADAVVDGRERLSWAALRDAADAGAADLRARGVQAAHRVGMRAGDGAAALVAALSAMRLGAVHVPVDHQARRAEAAELLRALRGRLAARAAPTPRARRALVARALRDARRLGSAAAARQRLPAFLQRHHRDGQGGAHRARGAGAASPSPMADSGWDRTTACCGCCRWPTTSRCRSCSTSRSARRWCSATTCARPAARRSRAPSA